LLDSLLQETFPVRRMSLEDVGRCHCCLRDYNREERRAKLLRCYHTACSECLESMVEAGSIQCPVCSAVTLTRRVPQLPDNPYVKFTAEEKEIFFSDDEEEEQPYNRSETGASTREKEQEENVIKVTEILNLCNKKVLRAARIGIEESNKLRQVLDVTETFKLQLEEDLNQQETASRNLEMILARINYLMNELEEVDNANTKAVNLIYEEAIEISGFLYSEVLNNNSQDLKHSLERSSVKVEFDRADEFLKVLKAGNDRLTLSLATEVKEPPAVYLLGFLLSNIFRDKISTFNSTFKELHGIDSSLEKGIWFESKENVEQKVTEQFLLEKEEKEIPQSSQLDRTNNPSFSEITKKPPLNSQLAKETDPNVSEKAKRLPLVKNICKKTVGETNRPHCFFMVQVENDRPFRVVFELRPDMAPTMVDNFIKLCCGRRDGRGYKGSTIFSVNSNKYVVGGDFEKNDGTGGRSAFEARYFVADQTSLKDLKGTIRMRGSGTGGKYKVASQFQIWIGDVVDRNYKISLVFGKVVEGMEELTEVSRIRRRKRTEGWVMKKTVTVIDSGTL